MADSVLEWACCPTKDVNQKFLQCDNCRKAFHFKCLLLDLSSELTTWTCPVCISMTPKEMKDDRTPVRFNTNATGRSNKRPALQSPPDTSATSVSENGIRTVVESVMETQLDSLLIKFTSTMRMMLSSELKTMREEIKDVKASVDFMNHQYEDIVRENKEQKQKIKELQDQNNRMSTTINEISGRINNLEQQTRSSNIEIQCIPQKKNENLMQIVTELGKVINSEVKEEDISHCTRVMKSNSSNNRPKSIIVQFNRPRLRDSFLAASINFNKSKPPADKLNTSHLGFTEKKSPIYITEHLSLANKALHAATRIRAKEKGYKHVWVRGGRIYTRKTDLTEYILIRNMDSLSKLV